MALCLALAFQMLDQFFEFGSIGLFVNEAESVIGEDLHYTPFDVPEGFMGLGGGDPVGEATYDIWIRVLHINSLSQRCLRRMHPFQRFL